ncbi:DUF2263 domain-containing protein [Microdochium nivale]|nr:DUF2263 domain-containing protein [Microdochium nivale]
MGRTEPSLGRPPPGFRRDARAKKAKTTINKLIPALLNAHPRARRGIDAAELIVEPKALAAAGTTTSVATTKPTVQHHEVPLPNNYKARSSGKGKAKGKKGRAAHDQEQEDELTTTPDRPGRRRRPAPDRSSRPDKDGSRPSSHTHDQNTSPSTQQPPRIRLAIADTLTVARYLLEPDPTGDTDEEGDDDDVHRRRRPNRRPDLANTTSRVAILNMASPLSPGGGFLNGAMAQEESLCMRTTLLPSLRDGFYRLPELGAVYTPDVLVFRDEAGGDLEKRDRWFVDCVSAAMLRFPDVEEVPLDSEPAGAAATGRGQQQSASTRRGLPPNIAGGASSSSPADAAGACDDDSDDDDDDDEDLPGGPVLKRYIDQKDRDLVLHKMRVVMRVLQSRGCRRVVLGGAWGCGAYGNPVEEVAAAWRKVLLPALAPGSSSGGGGKTRAPKENWHGIEEIVLAIKGGGMASRFESAFLGGTTAASLSSSSASAVAPTAAAAAVYDNELPIVEALEKIDPVALIPFSSMSKSSRIGSSHGTGQQQQQQQQQQQADEDENDPEALRMRELRERIETFELQVGQARTPQLRTGLSAVLAGLRSQLPPDLDTTTPTEADCEDDDADEDDKDEDAGSDSSGGHHSSDEAREVRSDEEGAHGDDEGISMDRLH